MSTRGTLLAVFCSALAAGCAERPAETSETQEIIDNLVAAGFPASDIMVVDGIVYVGRDAEVTLAASREMLPPDHTSKEQYRTTNLISTSLTKICINGSAFTGVFSTALNLAIENYEQQPLTFAMARTPSTGCSFTINGVIIPGQVGGSSGFPSGGLPFGTINIGGGLSTFSVDTIEHVITHEIGHAIGLRHSDFFNRAISCGGAPINEGDAGIGAILVPGTPSGAVVGGSIMNSCFRTNETGEFTATDVTAIRRLYGPLVTGTIVDGATNAPVAQALQVTVEGRDRNLVTDANGVPTTSFGVTGGTLSIRFATSVNPTDANPVKITLVIRRAGFVPTSVPLSLVGAVTQFSVRMANLALPPSGVATARVQGQANASGAVTTEIRLQAIESVSSVTATVTVPAGTVITDASGVPLSGTLTMDGAYFSPTVGSSLAAFPGGFSVDTTDASGATTSGEFVSAGLMSVEIADATGRQAKNFSGAGIQIAMELPSGTVNPVTSRPMVAGDVIPIFSNDTATGRWFEEGTVTATTAANGKLIAVFNARHLSLWNLDFKRDRCVNIGAATGFKSRRINVLDVFGAPVCPGKMLGLRISVSLVGGPAPAGYLRVLTPTAPEPDIIQFINAPQVNLGVIQVFKDANNNGVLDGPEALGNKVFFGPVGSPDNLCPSATSSTATLFLSVPGASVPGSC